jgi:hypothetical protein
MVNMTPKEAYFKCENENRRIHELESIIATNSECCYCYARDVIKGRWEEGEKIISTEPEISYRYARNIIKGRFEGGEKSISTDSKYSLLYAHHVLKGPFLLGQHIIFNSEYKDVYVNFLKSINYDLNEISEWLI